MTGAQQFGREVSRKGVLGAIAHTSALGSVSSTSCLPAFLFRQRQRQFFATGRGYTHAHSLAPSLGVGND